VSYKHETAVVSIENLDATLDARVADGWACTNIIPQGKMVLAVFVQWQANDERDPFIVDKSMFAATKNKKPIQGDGFGWAPGLPKSHIEWEENVDGFAR
jgi:hypothetical protein